MLRAVVQRKTAGAAINAIRCGAACCRSVAVDSVVSDQDHNSEFFEHAFSSARLQKSHSCSRSLLVPPHRVEAASVADFRRA